MCRTSPHQAPRGVAKAAEIKEIYLFPWPRDSAWRLENQQIPEGRGAFMSGRCFSQPLTLRSPLTWVDSAEEKSAISAVLGIAPSAHSRLCQF
jgi:hypothetical protein